MEIDPASLPDDPVILRENLVNLTLEAAGLRAEIDKLHMIIKAFQRHRYGQRSEQLNADERQLVIEDLEQAMGEGAAASDALGGVLPADPKQPNEKRTRKPRERNIGQLPDSLPRYTVTLDLKDKTCPCCQGELHRVGETKTEMLDKVPATLRVKVILRPRYTCEACDTPPVQAPAPERPIDGGMATEALIAHILISKFCDYLPLHRQSQMFQRQGIMIDRSTLGDWIGRACWWLRPLYDRIVSHVMTADKIFADDTGVPVLDPGRGKTKTGRFWCYAVDDRPWRGPLPPAAAYVYAVDRKGIRPAGHVEDFRGTMQVDGYAGFGQVAKERADASVKLVFCWAHARRGLFEVHKSTQSPIAAEALARIAALYAIEKDIRGRTAAQRQAERHARSRPLVDAMHVWLQQQHNRISKSSTLAKAIRYVFNHWEGLTYFLEDGRLELDTNTVEREIRPIVLCRKNALFAGNDSGAEHWAIAATLIASAKLNDVNPEAYLTDVLERIVAGKTRSTELDSLLPWNWRPGGEAELAAAA
jgi:transposase